MCTCICICLSLSLYVNLYIYICLFSHVFIYRDILSSSMVTISIVSAGGGSREANMYKVYHITSICVYTNYIILLIISLVHVTLLHYYN